VSLVLKQLAEKGTSVDLQQIGWNDFFADQCRDTPYLPGRIALIQRGYFTVWMKGGELLLPANASLRRRGCDWPCIGDWVLVQEESSIVSVLARRTRLSRKQPGSQIGEQVLAANVDVLFVVSGLDLDYNPRRLERYLLLANESGARPVLVLNKADLCDEPSRITSETRKISSGAPVLAISATEGWGVSELADYIGPGQTAALIGSSGAGKSTILNALLGAPRQRTRQVSEAGSRGRHTTTQRELFVMPDGSLLMDLPGLRELQLWVEPGHIDSSFRDIAELAQHCRFRNCTHDGEPGCAVAKGEINEGRLRSYRKLGKEAAFLARQQDIHAALKEKRRIKAVERSMRARPAK
jgi:ribosome biogenesis GTPase